MRKEAWTLAIETLSWMEMQKLSERLALARTTKQLGIKDVDAVRFAYTLVCETTKRRNFIDKFINKVLRATTIEELDLGVQAFLRLYVYQSRIAHDWANPNIKEAATIVKMGRSILGWKAFQRIEFALGNLLTQKPNVVYEDASDAETVGLKTFHPTWFVKYCFRTFGRAETLALLEANNKPLPTYIRLNTLKADEKRILEALTQDGVTIEKEEQLNQVYKVTSTKKALTLTTSYKEGLFTIQDKATCIIAENANPKPGMTVMDVCAAPGALTTCLAQLMQNKGTIYSVDYSRRRMRLWKARIDHAGVEIAEPLIADASKQLPIIVQAEVVVLNPPSTSTGLFAKLPSAKWRLTPDSVEQMAELQWQMLNRSAEYVKPGGTLVYATSSVTVEENETLIERFLKWHPAFMLDEAVIRESAPSLRRLNKCMRLYPHLHKSSGGFMAKLKRIVP